MKILYILNIAKQVNNFSYTAMLAAQQLGWEFHIAGHWSYASVDELHADEEKYGIHIHQIDFIRQPYNPQNIYAYRQLVKLMHQEKFDVVHCNTPVGGLLGRLAANKCKAKTVIYQAHGFHFYKGAPLLNWLIYYPIEKWLARKTDVLITINHEDCERAKKKFKLRKDGKVYYVPGVGIDNKMYSAVAAVRNEKLGELGLTDNNFILISMGDVIKRKNYKVVIDAIREIADVNIRYLICGEGPKKNYLENYAQKTGVAERILFLGFRSDVKELLKISDVFILSSRQEGLSRSLMEAMSSGLPCVVSNIRGNTDLIANEEGGILCLPCNAKQYASAINLLKHNPTLREKMKENNLTNISQFTIEKAQQSLKEIYKSIEQQEKM